MLEVSDGPHTERFELVLTQMRDGDKTFQVPIVNGWLELQLALLYVPNSEEQRVFFSTLSEMRKVIETRCPNLAWYFLHKAPGLKLRFCISPYNSAALILALSTVENWEFDWLGGIGIGSVFDQTELLPFIYRREIEGFLTRAADHYLLAVCKQLYCGHEEWVEFLIKLLATFGLDKWTSYEAICRLQRLRAAEFRPSTEQLAPLFSPQAMLADLVGPWRCGFGASVSLLQALNLCLNLWAVNGSTQHIIFSEAKRIICPALLVVSHD